MPVTTRPLAPRRPTGRLAARLCALLGPLCHALAGGESRAWGVAPPPRPRPTTARR